ncbi:unnamed protein product [Ilex paraguariensis]|uniref:Uncharacterized protein n=1 Tax=Ilex paraguariensis TaxID=185542 RepID=A0ABC8TIK3_9AQUA
MSQWKQISKQELTTDMSYFGLIFALITQSLAANLGVSTGKHLAELCKAEYPQYVKYFLWLLAEIAVIAADIPEGMPLN